MKKAIYGIGAALLSAGFLASGAYAHGFGGHGGKSSALHSCIAVMSATQRANLKQTFQGQKQTWMTDHQNVANARKALASAILGGSKDVSSQEAALSSAQQQAQKDQDAFAGQVCGQLSATQLSAAQTLYGNVSSLRESEHQQMRTYWQQAQAAAGNNSSQTDSPSGAAQDD